MNMEFKIPLPLKVEHQELHSELAKAIESGGDTGEAANTVAEEVLYPASILLGEYLKLRLFDLKLIWKQMLLMPAEENKARTINFPSGQ